MKINKMKMPIIIILVTILMTVCYALVSGIAYKPTTTEKVFSFSITYKYNGEEKTINDNYNCSFIGASNSIDPKDRFYEGKILSSNDANVDDTYVLFDNEKGTLLIHTNLYADYLMGDASYDDYYVDIPYGPFLAYYDAEGIEYTDEETLSKFGVEITQFDYPEPCDNSLEFSHITRLTPSSVFPMALFAFIGFILCLVFVKTNEETKSEKIYKIGKILTFGIGIIFIPFSLIFCPLVDINGDGSSLISQIDYIIPALSIICLGLSVSLRRNGYFKPALTSMFIGPIIFLITLIVDIF